MRCSYAPDHVTEKGAEVHQESGLDSFEEGTLHIQACHRGLAHHAEAVAHCTGLLQAVAPAQGVMLQ